eukprot:scaffold124638_cov66-Phaeocystis_antarctica.AAC.2
MLAYALHSPPGAPQASRSGHAALCEHSSVPRIAVVPAHQTCGAVGATGLKPTHFSANNEATRQERACCSSRTASACRRSRRHKPHTPTALTSVRPTPRRRRSRRCRPRCPSSCPARLRPPRPPPPPQRQVSCPAGPGGGSRLGGARCIVTYAVGEADLAWEVHASWCEGCTLQYSRRAVRRADLAGRGAANNARLEDERRRAEVLGDGRLGLGLALDIVAEDELGRVRVRVRVKVRVRVRASGLSSVGRGEGRDRAGLGEAP